jgi:hypothetical protein
LSFLGDCIAEEHDEDQQSSHERHFSQRLGLIDLLMFSTSATLAGQVEKARVKAAAKAETEIVIGNKILPMPPRKVGCHRFVNNRWEKIPCLPPAKAAKLPPPGAMGEVLLTPGAIVSDAALDVSLDQFGSETDSLLSDQSFSLQLNTNWYNHNKKITGLNLLSNTRLRTVIKHLLYAFGPGIRV